MVNEWFITRYTPLLNGRGRVVGSLYVGARESSFLTLVHNFNKRVALIAFICILLAGVIAVPIARLIIKPIDALVQANRRLSQGDMAVRVKVYRKRGTGRSGPLLQHHGGDPEPNPDKNWSIKKSLPPWASLPLESLMKSTTRWAPSCCIAETLNHEAGEGMPSGRI